ncbi:hypothetical protein [Vibrio sp. WXL210]|uniref:hypothetical protein n=1 Tax=Vibrio sp. WXL210 TaxID=3450709 RepID=UPI003EC84920
MYLSVWVTSPILAYSSIGRLIALISLSLWFALELTYKNGIFFKPTILSIITLVYVVYTLIVNYYAEGVANIISGLQLYILLVFVIIGESYYVKGYEKLKPVLLITLTLMPVWLFMTYVGLEENVRAARIVIRSSDEAVKLSQSGVGGFSLIYFSVLYVSFLLPSLKYFKISTPQKISFIALIIVNIVFASVVVLKAQYSAALILLVFCYIFFFVSGKEFSFMSLFYALIYTLLLLIFWVYKIEILQMISKVLDGSNYQLKISDLIHYFQGQSTGTVDDRVERYERSFVLFFDNPILGTIYRDPIGKHSQVLDNFAQYGFFIGSIFLFVILYRQVKILITNRFLYSITFPTFVVTFFLFALNNIAMSFGLAMSLLFPALLSLYEKEK